MKTTVNNSDFHDAFRNYDRLDNFSYEARNIIFEYLEEYEESTGEEVELDVIAICCDYTESDYDDIAADYMFYNDAEGLKEFKDLEDEERMNIVREYLEYNTIILGETSSVFVYANF